MGWSRPSPGFSFVGFAWKDVGFRFMLGLALVIPNRRTAYVPSIAVGGCGRHWLAGAKVISIDTPELLSEASSA